MNIRSHTVMEQDNKERTAIAEARREQILDAALKCFAKRGFHQTSMAEVCTEAKLSPGSVYRYFRSKDDIIAALAEVEHRELAQVYERAAQATTTRDAFDILLDVWLSSGYEKEGYDGPDFSVVYLEVCAEAARNPQIAKLAEAFDATQLALIESVLERAAKQGELTSPTNRATLARLIVATLDGMMLRFAYDKSQKHEDYRSSLRAFLYAAVGLTENSAKQ